MAKAIRYVLTHGDGLTRFVDEGSIELDTNTVARAIRPLALTRRIVSSPSAKAVPNTGRCWRRGSPPACVDGLRGARAISCDDAAIGGVHVSGLF